MHALQGSQAYAKALAKAGVLTKEEAECIVEGLGKVWPTVHAKLHWNFCPQNYHMPGNSSI